MKLAANLSWMYRHLAWKDRFEAAANDGFKAVEILMPYEAPASWYADQLHSNGLELVLFNTPIEPRSGRVGLAAVKGEEKAFAQQFDQALALAEATGCRRIHCMAGTTDTQAAADTRSTLLGNLEHAISLAERDGVVLLLEALNRSDAPGYCYHLPDQVLPILRHFDSPHLRMQFDFYHCVKEGLDCSAVLSEVADWIGHVQVAGAPDRHEPDLSQHELLDALASLPERGYDSWIGCEYLPAVSAAQGLVWCEPLRDRGVLA